MVSEINIQLVLKTLETHNKKDIIDQSANQSAIVGVIWDPRIVLSSIHSALQVSVT